MMAEMIANYQAPGKSPVATAAPVPHEPLQPRRRARRRPRNGSGYLNEVSPLTARRASGEPRLGCRALRGGSAASELRVRLGPATRSENAD